MNRTPPFWLVQFWLAPFWLAQFWLGGRYSRDADADAREGRRRDKTPFFCSTFICSTRRRRWREARVRRWLGHFGLGTMPALLTARRLCQVRAGLGATHLLLPGTAARLLVREPLGRRARGVVRVLGVRQLAQALATSAEPTATVLVLGVEMDLAHGASMVALGLMSHRWRRVAFVDAVIAVLFAYAGARLSRATPRPDARGGLTALRDRLAARVARRLVPNNFTRGVCPGVLGGGDPRA